MVSSPELKLKITSLGRQKAGADNELLQTFLDDLQDAGIPINLEHAKAPDGSKAGIGNEIVSIVLSSTLSVAGLRALREIIVAFLHRADGRRVELTRGDDRIVLEAAPTSDVRLVLEAWLRPEGSDSGEGPGM